MPALPAMTGSQARCTNHYTTLFHKKIFFFSTTNSDSILSAGLCEDEDEDDSDPFIPQERVFSKYAAMVYTSNNQGKSYEEFKDAKYCPSCGEKVAIYISKLDFNIV